MVSSRDYSAFRGKVYIKTGGWGGGTIFFCPLGGLVVRTIPFRQGRISYILSRRNILYTAKYAPLLGIVFPPLGGSRLFEHCSMMWAL